MTILDILNKTFKGKNVRIERDGFYDEFIIDEFLTPETIIEVGTSKMFIRQLTLEDQITIIDNENTNKETPIQTVSKRKRASKAKNL